MSLVTRSRLNLPARHDEEIDIAIWSHLTACCRTEKDDLVWLRFLDNALNDLSEDLLVRACGFLTASFGSHPEFSTSRDGLKFAGAMRQRACSTTSHAFLILLY
jgi:hypothetical protein